jgi:SNF family Na+-dependent transporter
MEKQDQWTSRLGFILATAGSVIGLGAFGNSLI